MPQSSRNPATGEISHTFDEHDAAAVEAKLATAGPAFERQRRMSFAERAARMHAAADILEREKAQLGRLMTLEMGKPLEAAIAEAVKCALACRFYADRAEDFLADQPIETGGAGGRVSFIRHQPIGAVLAVMPWNFPFWQVFRFVAPGLMAGNVGLLKHASNVPQCALAIEDILHRAGFDPGVFQTLLVGSDRVAALIRDPRVHAVTLTGSEGAGAAVARTAGECIKKTVLELGGSDPFIVMPSADIDAAAQTAVTARTINNGQSCIAAKRFIVADAVHDAFAERFVAGMRALRVGNPLDVQTQIGPLATASIRDEVAEQVRRSVQHGARLLTGGSSIEGPGWFYAPTVLADVPPDAPAWREEIFGPVAALVRARDLDHAIRLANDTAFGLGSAAWTRDADEQRRFIDEIEAGQVFINGMVASDPRLPFGGIKRSGYGRELGRAGILEFVNIKTVVIAAMSRSEKHEATE
ncbi:MAG: NAD-dependent succinate-semialdehyde dehydrogenase [Gemmatimonadota bacterium]